MNHIFSKEWYGAVLSSVYPEGAVWYETSTNVQLFQLHNFLDKQECSEIIEAFKGKVEPSQTTCGSSDFRTSSCFNVALSAEHRDMCVKIEKKICDALNLSFSHSEGLQFEYFKAGQYYKHHTDWFLPESEEYNTHASRWGQRTWTVQIGLSEPEKGGEIVFRDLDIKPFAIPLGAAVAWNNINESGEVQELVGYEHKPVIKGDKCLFTKHFRMKSLIE
jgi:prolyl 4-hydroxylase